MTSCLGGFRPSWWQGVEGMGVLLLCGNTWLNKAIYIMARKERVQALPVYELKLHLGLQPQVVPSWRPGIEHVALQGHF